MAARGADEHRMALRDRPGAGFELLEALPARRLARTMEVIGMYDDVTTSSDPVRGW
jgi:hypothetical protein